MPPANNPDCISPVHYCRKSHEKAYFIFPFSLADCGGHLGPKPSRSAIPTGQAINCAGNAFLIPSDAYPADSF